MSEKAICGVSCFGVLVAKKQFYINIFFTNLAKSFDMIFQRFITSAARLGIHHREKIIIALSGGADSVVLLDLLIRYGSVPVIAHCNFNLRGDESDGDEKFVRDLALKKRLCIYVKRFNTEKEASERKLSIQETARDLRYEWFIRLSEKLKISKIAVAHNSGDVAETFMINLMRGCGLNGLSGIPAKSGKVVRPLLFAERKDIEAYADQHGLKYRNDSSNKSDKYLRNQIRNELFPLMNGIRPGAVCKITEAAGLINLYRKFVEEMIKEKAKGIIKQRGQKTVIKRRELSSFSHPLLLLHHFLSPLGFTPDTSARLAATKDIQPGKKFFSSTHVLTVSRSQIIAEPKISTDVGIMTITCRGEYEWNGFVFNVELCQSIIPENGRDKVLIDEVISELPWTIRSWQAGDKMKPFGLKGSKKISDLLTDASVPSDIKSQWPVLIQGSEIVWLPGVRSSEKLRVKKWSGRAWRITCINPEI